MVLVKVMLRLLSWLPLRLLHALSIPLAAILRRVSSRRRRVATANINACFPDLSAAERSVLLRQTFRHYVCSVLELGALQHWSIDRLLGTMRTVHGQALLDTAGNSGKPMIIAAPHFGAWEWLNIYIAQQVDLGLMFKPSGKPGVDDWLLKLRSRGGANVFATDSRGMRGLVKHLKTKGPVGILPDQEPSLGEGRWSTFFDQPALTGVFLPRLAARTDATVLFLAVRRLPKGQGFDLHILPAAPQLADKDLDKAVRAVNDSVEACVRLDVPQYLWTYKRFRRQPDGESIY